MRNLAIAAALAAAAWTAAGQDAAAQFEADSEAPIEITADTMVWREEQRVAVASGDADAVQGRYRLFADVLTAHLYERETGDGSGEDSETAGQVRLIEADGNVRFVTPEETATGSEGVYDVENREVVLTGAVVLTQGESVARGSRLDMDLATGVSRLTAAEAAGGRVTAILAPGDGEPEGGEEDSGAGEEGGGE